MQRGGSQYLFSVLRSKEPSNVLAYDHSTNSDREIGRNLVLVIILIFIHIVRCLFGLRWQLFPCIAMMINLNILLIGLPFVVTWWSPWRCRVRNTICTPIIRFVSFISRLRIVTLLCAQRNALGPLDTRSRRMLSLALLLARRTLRHRNKDTFSSKRRAVLTWVCFRASTLARAAFNA
jgi:hypothetical protein